MKRPTKKIRYAVSIEVCHLLDADEARELAGQIRNRLNDINEDIYVCISEYEQVRAYQDKKPLGQKLFEVTFDPPMVLR